VNINYPIFSRTLFSNIIAVNSPRLPSFLNCTFISVDFDKIKVIIYESIHFKHVVTFIPYSLRTSQILFFRDSSSLCTFKQFGRGDGKKKKVWGLGCMLGVSLLAGAYSI
jgi:hypothetical protein